MNSEKSPEEFTRVVNEIYKENYKAIRNQTLAQVEKIISKYRNYFIDMHKEYINTSREFIGLFDRFEEEIKNLTSNSQETDTSNISNKNCSFNNVSRPDVCNHRYKRMFRDDIRKKCYKCGKVKDD